MQAAKLDSLALSACSLYLCEDLWKEVRSTIVVPRHGVVLTRVLD